MSFIKLDTPIMRLDFEIAFSQLTEKEKNYCYYLNKACWEGLPIILFQISYESPALFIIFQNFFSSFSSFEELQKVIATRAKIQVTSTQYKQFIAYAASFYGNVSNYHSFGHTKFIPELECNVFEEILKCSTTFSEIQYIWDCIKDIVYDNSDQSNNINLKEKGGANYYYIGDIKEEKIKQIDNFLIEKKISPLNTRLLKLNSNQYAYLVGCIDHKLEKWEDPNIIGYYSEFSEFLKRVNENLKIALKFCANQTQENMLKEYIISFENGSIEKHKDSQRLWVKDRDPVVEFNMGWVETYIDPMGVRAYYEGWVALTDKEKSRKFKLLVDNAEKYVKSLPWPKEFERDIFIQPEFTAIDVVCFASNGCPLGINIPNYDDVIEECGSKNVCLSNAYPKMKITDLKFAPESDKELMVKIGQASYNLHVGCHELLGHGTGKIFKKNENETFNFDNLKTINPLTNSVVDSFYTGNQTFESKFGDICRSYEECRADLCGLFFCFFKDIHTIFEVDEENYKDTIYVIWLMYIRKGVVGLQLYNESTKKWGQAHTQGAWVFTQFLLKYQTQGNEILKIVIDEKENNFNILLNKNNLLEYGQDIAAKLLLNLQVWKSTGDSERAREFYYDFSQVDDYFLKIKKIIEQNKQPRRLELNNNLVMESNNKTIGIKIYNESFEGIIESFRDRYGTRINNDIYSQWTKYEVSSLLEK